MSVTYSVNEFCKAFGISRSKLYQLWHDNQGPVYFHVGKRRLISYAAAEAWRARLETETQAQAREAA